ncbi:small HSP21-like protein [Aphelenchoides avenae]|nr:small HSP21-like protein [Aphelenchus avenae]
MSHAWPFSWHPSKHWVSPFTSANFNEFYDEYARKHAHDQRGLGHTELTKDGDFRWTCNVSGYLPEELKVELDGNMLVVTGEHKETKERESVYRLLKRQVVLPEDTSKGLIRSRINDRGELEIEAPCQRLENEKKRNIPIEFWGPVLMRR